jgi:hypothetical protein
MPQTSFSEKVHRGMGESFDHRTFAAPVFACRDGDAVSAVEELAGQRAGRDSVAGNHDER